MKIALHDHWFSWALVILAFIGFADAAYLTAEHYLGGIPTCLITTGCETVLTSRFATIGPIPVALLGALYYLVVFLLGTSMIDRPSVSRLRLLSGLVGLGFLASIGFIYIQIAILKALCIYCLVSATTTTLLVLTAIGLWRHQPQRS